VFRNNASFETLPPVALRMRTIVEVETIVSIPTLVLILRDCGAIVSKDALTFGFL
jgi:hypothetical protein